MGQNKYLGVDLGGTNIKIGLVDEEGKLISHFERATEASKGFNFVIERIVEMAKEVTSIANADWADVRGLGIGIPGFLDLEQGIVRNAVNIGWIDVPVVSFLSEALAIPVALDNDANVAALGEAWSGAGAGFQNVVCVTLGTGVGGGIIINGQLFHGKSNMAGEIGHMPIVYGEEARLCNCRKRGCLETAVAAPGLIKTVNEAIASGKKTPFQQNEVLSAKAIFEQAGLGDTFAKEVVHNATDVLGRALAIISVTVNPERFVIGGGLSRAGDTLFGPLRQSFIRYGLEEAVNGVDVVPATLGNDAGIIGAAGLIARA